MANNGIYLPFLLSQNSCFWCFDFKFLTYQKNCYEVFLIDLVLMIFEEFYQNLYENLKIAFCLYRLPDGFILLF